MKESEKVPTPEEIRLIFKDTYDIYKRYHDNKLFLAMIELLPSVTLEEAAKILGDGYLLYKNNQRPYLDDDWAKLIKEANSYLQKYDSPLADWIAKEVLDIIENFYKYKRYDFKN